ncbi:hypothetical protein C5S39_12280 [Candidatus Methanophagaceae archaeon]|nr:hypothetical protein C5S39_12280 [Methanophagales archaeon]
MLDLHQRDIMNLARHTHFNLLSWLLSIALNVSRLKEVAEVQNAKSFESKKAILYHPILV